MNIDLQFGFAQAKPLLLKKALERQPNSVPLLFELAEALAAAGEYNEAVEHFRRAYLLQPSCRPALPVAGVSDTHLKRFIEWTRTLIAQNAGFSPVIAALAVAESLIGNVSEVRSILDYQSFFRARVLPAAEELGSEDFRQKLAAGIRSDLRFYAEPEDRSIRQAWRNNGIFESRLPACITLADALRRHVADYINALPEEATHPFCAARPSDFTFEGWAVVSDGGSYHQSHIHPRAWMSGVYYVVSPSESEDDGSACGWLHVGPPSSSGDLPGWESRAIKPEPGTLVLMPAYFFHRTQPMMIDRERICVAFDVVPSEISSASNCGYD